MSRSVVKKSRRALFLVLLSAAACTRTPKTADAPPPYKPAVADYGAINNAWVYTAGTELKAEPGTMLIAADLTLPEPDGKFDLDDVDLFDADTGENFGSDPHLQRLTLKGDFIDHDDPDVAGQGEYRGVFVWAVPAGVKRVNFGYWGDMLYVKPVTLGTDPRVLPEQRVTAIQIGKIGEAPGYERYAALLDARNTFRTYKPALYKLADSRAPQGRDLCDTEAWIELDEDGRLLQLAVTQRPHLIERRLFLVEYWCPAGARPDSLDHFGSRSPLPALQSSSFKDEALAALAAAERERYALHRLK